MPAAKSPLRGACFPRRRSFLSARARVRCGWYQDLGQDGAVQLIHGHLGDPMGRSGNLLGPEFDRSSIQEVFSDHDAEMLIVQPDSTGRARSWRRAGARPAACARAFPRASPLSQHRPAGGRRAGDRAARGTRCCAGGGGIEPARAREAAKRRCRRRWRCGRSASGARACVLAGEPPCTAPELPRVLARATHSAALGAVERRGESSGRRGNIRGGHGWRCPVRCPPSPRPRPPPRLTGRGAGAARGSPARG